MGSLELAVDSDQRSHSHLFWAPWAWAFLRKDINGNTGCMNLYSQYVNSLELFKVWTFKNLRKGEVTKNEETHMRLHTTTFTKIENASIEDALNFQGIGNGQFTLTGQIIGCGEVSLYRSCKVHYNKVDDESNCPKCQNKVPESDIFSDFRLDMYIQVHKNAEEEEDIEVKEITVFKRALISRLENCSDDDVELMIDGLTGKAVKIDYNVDESERLIAVSLDITG